MTTDSTIRIDKFLWAVRIFKTRSIAAEACKKGRVTIGGINVKSSRTVKIGEIIEVKIPPITKSFKVLDLSGKRMGAKLTPNFIEEVTTPDQIELLEMTRLANSLGRRRGLGRPTKRDRRDIEKMNNGDWE